MISKIEYIVICIAFILLFGGLILGIYKVSLREELRNQETQKCEEYCFPYTVISCTAKKEDFTNKKFDVLVVCSETKQVLLQQ